MKTVPTLEQKIKAVLHAVGKSSNEIGNSLLAHTPHGCPVQPFYQSKDVLNFSLLGEHLGTARTGIVTDSQMGTMRFKAERTVRVGEATS